jgi:hypothetical protein
MFLVVSGAARDVVCDAEASDSGDPGVPAHAATINGITNAVMQITLGFMYSSWPALANGLPR